MAKGATNENNNNAKAASPNKPVAIKIGELYDLYDASAKEDRMKVSSEFFEKNSFYSVPDVVKTVLVDSNALTPKNELVTANDESDQPPSSEVKPTDFKDVVNYLLSIETMCEGTALVYIDGHYRAQIVPFGASASLVRFAATAAPKSDRENRIADLIRSTFPSMSPTVRATLLRHCLAWCATFDQNEEFRSQIENRIGKNLAGNALPGYVNEATQSLSSWNYILKDAILLGVVIRQLRPISHDSVSATVKDVQDGENFLFFFRLYFPQLHDLLTFKTYKQLQSEKAAVAASIKSAIGVAVRTPTLDSLARHLHWVELFSTLKVGRVKDKEDILDIIPEKYYNMARGDMAGTRAPRREDGEGPMIPAVGPNNNTPDKKKKKEKMKKKDRDTTAERRDKKIAASGVNFFPDATKADYNNYVSELQVPEAKRADLYQAVLKAKKFPGHTNGALDKAAVKAAWDEIK